MHEHELSVVMCYLQTSTRLFYCLYQSIPVLTDPTKRSNLTDDNLGEID
jgi:hypothetical protein